MKSFTSTVWSNPMLYKFDLELSVLFFCSSDTCKKNSSQSTSYSIVTVSIKPRIFDQNDSAYFSKAPLMPLK